MNDFGHVNLNGECVNVSGYNADFELYLPGIIRSMSIRDFKKMLSVIENQITPHDYLHFLRLFQTAAAHFPGIIDYRRDRLLNAIDAKMDRLPGDLFMEDPEYEN